LLLLLPQRLYSQPAPLPQNIVDPDLIAEMENSQPDQFLRFIVRFEATAVSIEGTRMAISAAATAEQNNLDAVATQRAQEFQKTQKEIEAKERWSKTWPYIVLVLVIAGGLSAFWYNPEFVRLSLVSSPGRAVMAAVKNLIPLSFFVLPVLGTFGFLIFDKRAHLQPLFVALGLTIVFGLISFAGGLAKFAVSAQSRYHPEVSMALSILWRPWVVHCGHRPVSSAFRCAALFWNS